LELTGKATNSESIQLDITISELDKLTSELNPTNESLLDSLSLDETTLAAINAGWLDNPNFIPDPEYKAWSGEQYRKAYDAAASAKVKQQKAASEEVDRVNKALKIANAKIAKTEKSAKAAADREERALDKQIAADQAAKDKKFKEMFGRGPTKEELAAAKARAKLRNETRSNK
jgi:hypothetical protein